MKASSHSSKYTTIKTLGEGGYGKALLVRNKEDKRLYVMKTVKIKNLSPKDKADALREATLLSVLKCPFIVAFLESFEEKGILYIVMEYADGGDLSQKMQRRKNNPKHPYFSEDEILHDFIQVCLALKYLHDRKVLHRDLKAQNVFLMKDGAVKLGDFGIAKVLQNTMQLAMSQIGTPYYLSPEICDNKKYNSKTDIWSLGCMLYEMCTFRHPFDAKDIKSLMKRILNAKYVPISDKRYSDDLRGLLGIMLNKDPNKRPTINQILGRPFIKSKLSNFLDQQMIQYELNHTILHGANIFKNPHPPLQQHQDQHQAQPQPQPQNQKQPTQQSRQQVQKSQQQPQQLQKQQPQQQKKPQPPQSQLQQQKQVQKPAKPQNPQPAKAPAPQNQQQQHHQPPQSSQAKKPQTAQSRPSPQKQTNQPAQKPQSQRAQPKPQNQQNQHKQPSPQPQQKPQQPQPAKPQIKPSPSQQPNQPQKVQQPLPKINVNPQQKPPQNNANNQPPPSNQGRRQPAQPSKLPSARGNNARKQKGAQNAPKVDRKKQIEEFKKFAAEREAKRQAEELEAMKKKHEEEEKKLAQQQQQAAAAAASEASRAKAEQLKRRQEQIAKFKQWTEERDRKKEEQQRREQENLKRLEEEKRLKQEQEEEEKRKKAAEKAKQQRESQKQKEMQQLKEKQKQRLEEAAAYRKQQDEDERLRRLHLEEEEE